MGKLSRPAARSVRIDRGEIPCQEKLLAPVDAVRYVFPRETANLLGNLFQMHTNRSLKAQRVRVIREEGKTGLYYATSPDLKGLLVAETTLDALEREIPNAIRELYLACGESVVVTPLDDQDEVDAIRSWVAFPTEIADRERLKRVQ